MKPKPKPEVVVAAADSKRWFQLEKRSEKRGKGKESGAASAFTTMVHGQWEIVREKELKVDRTVYWMEINQLNLQCAKVKGEQ